MNINKILYIGTWHHIQPVRDFPQTKEFICIDTQPRNIFDNQLFYAEYYKHDFYDDLIHKCTCYGFKLKSEEILDKKYYKYIFTIKQRLYYSLYSQKPHHINPTLLIFYNEKTEQTIKYYMSTNIEYNMCTNLQQDIEEADALVVSRYHPNIKVLEYFTKPKIFIGYSNISYDIDEKYNDSIITLLHQQEKTKIKSEYFNKYIAISNKTGKIKECNDLFDLSKHILTASLIFKTFGYNCSNLEVSK